MSDKHHTKEAQRLENLVKGLRPTPKDGEQVSLASAFSYVLKAADKAHPENEAPAPIGAAAPAARA